MRNSIIRVDFIELKLREGMPLALAVEEAGVVILEELVEVAPVGTRRRTMTPRVPRAPTRSEKAGGVARRLNKRPPPGRSPGVADKVSLTVCYGPKSMFAVEPSFSSMRTPATCPTKVFSMEVLV